MTFKLGNSTINRIYYGSNIVSSIYFGNTVVYNKMNIFTENIRSILTNPNNLKGLYLFYVLSGSKVPDVSGNNYHMDLSVDASTLTPDSKSLSFTDNKSWTINNNNDMSFGNGTIDQPFSIIWAGKVTANSHLVSKELEYTLKAEQTTLGLYTEDIDNLGIDDCGKYCNFTDYLSNNIIIGTYNTEQFSQKIYINGINVSTTINYADSPYQAMSNNYEGITMFGDQKVYAVAMISECLNQNQVTLINDIIQSYL